MPTITLIREPAAILVDPDANVDRQPDWESPSGCDEAPFPAFAAACRCLPGAWQRPPLDRPGLRRGRYLPGGRRQASHRAHVRLPGSGARLNSATSKVNHIPAAHRADSSSTRLPPIRKLTDEPERLARC